MFTGIVTDIGTLVAVKDKGKVRRLRVASKYPARGIALGSSISHDGICLTVVAKGVRGKGSWFEVELGLETLARTTAGQWTKGKSCDTFNPLGPYLVTRDEVPDSGALQMTLAVNGVRMQNGNTRTMIFSPTFIIHYLSQFMTLEAGDVITTGTPPGVGMGMKPPQFLKPGDVVTLGIDGLGEQRQQVVKFKA